MQGFIAVFTVLQLPTPLKMSYEAAKKQAGRTPRSWESYERRETVQLVRQAVRRTCWSIIARRGIRRCGAGTLRDASRLTDVFAQ